MTFFRIIAAGVVIVGTVTASDASSLLCPWKLDWRHTAAWQHGLSTATPFFAPSGCFIDRWVVTSHSASWKRLYICR